MKNVLLTVWKWFWVIFFIVVVTPIAFVAQVLWTPIGIFLLSINEKQIVKPKEYLTIMRDACLTYVNSIKKLIEL